MLRKTLMGAVSVLFVAACGGGESDMGKPGAGGSLDDLASASKGWDVPCQDGAMTNIKVVGQTATLETRYIDEPSCNSTLDFTTVAHYSAVTQGTSSAEPSATNLNLTLRKLIMMPITQKAADEYNNNRICGYNGWTQSQEYDATDTTCGDAGAFIYTIFKVDGEVLYLGQDSKGYDGTTRSKRHVILNLAPVNKQL